MKTLLLLALAGLAGQLVDGALGMAFGITSTTVLLMSGIAPAAASQVVHLAEMGTTLTSGIAHWRFRNVDWRTVFLLAVPGALGGFTGAVILSGLTAAAAKPVISGVLVGLGLLILVRALRPRAPRAPRRIKARGLVPLGLSAGFLDALGGGGWGPMGTSTLLASGRMEPRKVIGSVCASEFLVTLGVSAGFLVGLGHANVNFAWAGALLAGGAVAAPFAAWTAQKLPAAVLASAVGGLIVLTNAGAVLEALQIPAGGRLALYLSVLALTGVALTIAVRVSRKTPRPTRSAPVSIHADDLIPRQHGRPNVEPTADDREEALASSLSER